MDKISGGIINIFLSTWETVLDKLGFQSTNNIL